jgi:hypothetical protein
VSKRPSRLDALAWLAALAWPQVLTAAAPPPAPTPCVSSSAELKPRELAEIFLHHKGQVDLSNAAGCLRLENGMELPALLLALPPFAGAYTIRIAAPTERSSYLQPRIDMLDAQYHTLRTFGAERLKRRGTEMSVEIFVNPEDARERFVLLYADPAHLGEQDQKTTSESRMLFVGTGVVILGDDKTAALRTTTEGKVTVQLLGEQWEKAERAERNRSR